MFLLDEAMSKQLYYKQSVIGLKMNDDEINRVEDSGEVCFGMNVNGPLESFQKNLIGFYEQNWTVVWNQEKILRNKDK